MENYHYHNGIDQPRINPVDLLGFPVQNTIPTYKSEQGTQVYVSNGIKYLYAFIDRVWTQIARASVTISNSATLNFGAISPHSSADLTIALTGAVDGDTIQLGVSNTVISTGTNCNNISFFAWVSAVNVVTIRCVNNDSANTANPASGTFRVTAVQL
jgi:hypothetical protein